MIRVWLFVLVLLFVLVVVASAGDYIVCLCKEEVGMFVYPIIGWHLIGCVIVEMVGDVCFCGGSLFVCFFEGSMYTLGDFVGW